MLAINGVNLLTDPFFSPAGSLWSSEVVILTVSNDPALKLDQLSVVDAVLSSYEDHS